MRQSKEIKSSNGSVRRLMASLVNLIIYCRSISPAAANTLFTTKLKHKTILLFTDFSTDTNAFLLSLLFFCMTDIVLRFANVNQNFSSIFLPLRAETLRRSSGEPTGGASRSAGDDSPRWRGRVPAADGPCDLRPQPGRRCPPPLTYGWGGTPCNAWGRWKGEIWDRRIGGKYLAGMLKIMSCLKKQQEEMRLGSCTS